MPRGSVVPEHWKGLKQTWLQETEHSLWWDGEEETYTLTTPTDTLLKSWRESEGTSVVGAPERMSQESEASIKARCSAGVS